MAPRFVRSLRAAAQEPGRWLGSWRLSIVLMVTAALYSGFLAIWATSSPPHVVANIAGLGPFWLVYGLLLTNTAVCLWRRIPVLRRQVAARPVLTERVSDWELPAGPAFDRERAEALLRRRRFRPVLERRDRLVGVRRRWAALGTFLFHGAFFLVAAGFLLSLGTRREATVWVAVGEEFTGRPDQYLSRSAPRALASGGAVPSDLTFRMSDLRPEFWRDQLLFTTLEADLELGGSDGADRVRATTRINRPLWLGWSSFLRLSGFGYAPRYELRDREGRVLDSAFVKMNLFPPGQTDYFRIEGFPHRYRLEVLPDVEIEGNRPATRSLALRRPGVLVEVSRGKLALAEGLVLVGQRPGRETERQTVRALAFEGLQISFPEIRTWAEISVVRDPGMAILFAGYLVGLTGLALRMRGGRSEMEWRSVDEGRRVVLRGWGCPAPDRATPRRGRGGDDREARGDRTGGPRGASP